MSGQLRERPPDGDATRRMAWADGSDSPAFSALNRGKRSVVLDLSQPAGREVCARLARTADIVLENFRPGVMQRMGLDYATLSAQHPRLIYASISGFGQTGPMASRGGFDLVAQGEDQTLLRYAGSAEVGGVVAGVGQRVLSGVAKFLVGRFFKALEKHILDARQASA